VTCFSTRRYRFSCPHFAALATVMPLSSRSSADRSSSPRIIRHMSLPSRTMRSGLSVSARLDLSPRGSNEERCGKDERGVFVRVFLLKASRLSAGRASIGVAPEGCRDVIKTSYRARRIVLPHAGRGHYCALASRRYRSTEIPCLRINSQNARRFLPASRAAREILPRYKGLRS
jgi:hypothetical protein